MQTQNERLDTVPVQPIVMLLERITVALEKIAGEHERQHAGNTANVEAKALPRESTPFPWCEVSPRCKTNLRRFWARDDRDGLYKWRTKYTWPFSCEDLVEIGFESLCAARNWGTKSGEEINAILCRMGFSSGSDWMST